MANFLSELSEYNAKASAAIITAIAECKPEKANLMSSLKTTANDITLSNEIRLDALTALINVGELLDIPLPPYFPLTTTYADSQSYTGIHNDLSGLQGGQDGEYYHLTLEQWNNINNAVKASGVSFEALNGVYTDNPSLVGGFATKQNALNGNGFVKASGGTITYDPSVYITDINGIQAGGDLTGFYPSPTITNAAVIGKVLTGFNPSASAGPISASDTIIGAIQKLNANILAVGSSTGTISQINFALPSNVFSYTAGPFTSGAANISGSFINQSQNTFFAGPVSGTGQPQFRPLNVSDFPVVSPNPAGTYGTTNTIPQITVDAYGRVTGITAVSAASGGQVNTVGFTVPAGGPFAKSITGTAADPIINLSLTTQAPNTVFAGPSSGVTSLAPQFRQLVVDDIPTLPVTKIDGFTNTLDGYLTDELSDGSIWIGNISNAATPQTLSGDVTVTRGGVTAIGAKKVQYAMIQDVGTKTLLGRYDTTNGPVQQVTLDPAQFTFSNGGVIGLQSPVAPVVTTKGDLLGHDLTAQQRIPSNNINGSILLVNNSATGAYTDLGVNWVAMSGDATINATGTITISNSVITLGKMANLAANSIIGNNTGSAAAPQPLSTTQVAAMLPVFDPLTTAKGLVPGGNNLGATYFLNATGGWVQVSGTGTVTNVSVTTNNGFAGTVADSTGNAAITIKLNNLSGVLKGDGNGAILPATAGTDYVGIGAITTSGLTIGVNKLAGRTNASPAAIQEIGVDGTMSLASATLGINLGSANTWMALQTFSDGIKISGLTGYVRFNAQTNGATQVYTLPAAYPGAGTTGYLKSTDAGVLTWDTATGTTTASVTFDAVAGNTAPKVFNGSQAMTIGYATVGAQQANANLTGLSTLTYASGTPFVKMIGAGTFALDTNTYISGTTTQYSVLIGGAGNSIVSVTPVVSNKLFVSNGTSAAPGWTDATYPISIVNRGILYGSGTDAVGQIAAPIIANTFLKWDGSTYTWATAGGGSGTVTSVGIAVPAFLSVTNSPITGAGDITIGLSGTALPITSGGTGGVTAIAARANILPIYTANYILGVNSAGTDVEWVGVTGSGNVVRATSPTLTTPNIGAATATSVNGLTITATTGTLTLVNGSTLSTAGAFSTTLTATGATNVTLPTTGTLATLAGTELLTNKTINSPIIGNGVGQGHLHLHTINNNPPSSPSADYITIFADDSPKRFGFQFGLDGFESYFEFAAASTSKTYTFPNATGTVALIDSTQTLTIPASVGASGSIALGVSGGGTVSLLAPATVAGAGVYTLPNDYPTGANQYLTATTGGIMSWVTIAAGGDVVGPNGGVADGDFVVFDGTTGKLIKEPLNASLTAAGRATFNSGVDVGVSGTTTGSLVFRNQTTAATTTLQASTSQITNLIYTLPITAPGAGNVLSSDINGNLSWTAAGSGNVTTGGTQTFTGTNTFNANSLRINNATNNGYHTLASLAAASATLTATFPAASGTVPLLSLAQTFTAAQTFQANVTLGTGSYNSTLLDFTGTTSNRINFNQTIASGPATNLTPSVGTRIVIANTGSASGSANSIGFNTGEMWLNHDLSGAISFYNNTTRFMRFTGGYLEMLGSAGSFRMEGTTSNMIRFNANGSSAPGYSSSGDFAGTKIIFLPQLGSGINSYAMGVNATDLWTAGAASYTWYGSSNTFLKQVITNGVSFGAVAATAGFMTLASGIPTILFNSQASNAPSTSSRSTGTRIVINPTFSAGVSTDSAIGVSGSGSGGAGNWQMWFSTPGTMNFYAGNATATPSIAMSTNGIVCNNGFSATTSQITFGGGLVNGWALIGATATASWAAPSTTTRVDGTRIVLYPVANATNNNYDAGIGITGTTSGGFGNVNTYISSPGDVRFYCFGAANPALRIGSTTLVLADSVNFQFDTNNGTKFGTGTGQKIGFFNATPVAQQTGGNLTAANAYGANEQTMLNRAFTALRNLGLISQ